MPRNVEIKARIDDVEGVLVRARRLSGCAPTVLEQDDTFFNCPNGRLKLRVLSDCMGELIVYQRSDIAGPKESSYVVVQTATPGLLRVALGQVLGVRGVVRKRRLLFVVGQTRVHVDDVEGLGWFIELEVVLSDDQDASAGAAEAHRLMAELGIQEHHLVRGAYLDLLEKGEDVTSSRSPAD
jgi:predicted adenylyl cyclase CyaB